MTLVIERSPEMAGPASRARKKSGLVLVKLPVTPASRAAKISALRNVLELAQTVTIVVIGGTLFYVIMLLRRLLADFNAGARQLGRDPRGN